MLKPGKYESMNIKYAYALVTVKKDGTKTLQYCACPGGPKAHVIKRLPPNFLPVRINA